VFDCLRRKESSACNVGGPDPEQHLHVILACVVYFYMCIFLNVRTYAFTFASVSTLSTAAQ
jgi:hypothetical protein